MTYRGCGDGQHLLLFHVILVDVCLILHTSPDKEGDPKRHVFVLSSQLGTGTANPRPQSFNGYRHGPANIINISQTSHTKP